MIRTCGARRQEGSGAFPRARMVPFILMGAASLYTWEAEAFFAGTDPATVRLSHRGPRLPVASVSIWIGLGLSALVAMSVYRLRYVVADWWILLLAVAWVLARHPQRRARPIGWLFLGLFVVASTGMVPWLDAGIL